jgi:hypothetical protein
MDQGTFEHEPSANKGNPTQRGRSVMVDLFDLVSRKSGSLTGWTCEHDHFGDALAISKRLGSVIE